MLLSSNIFLLEVDDALLSLADHYTNLGYSNQPSRRQQNAESVIVPNLADCGFRG